MASYKVLGVEGDEIEVAGEVRSTGDVIELSEEEAADALAESKIELVVEGGEVAEASAPAVAEEESEDDEDEDSDEEDEDSDEDEDEVEEKETV